MKIFNGCAHVVNIIDKNSCVFNGELRKYVSASPNIIRTIEKNYLLNAKHDIIEQEPIDGIPVRNKVLVSCDILPNADIIIASALYAVAAKAETGIDVFTIIDPVFDHEGKTILGCLAIGKVS